MKTAARLFVLAPFVCILLLSACDQYTSPQQSEVALSQQNRGDDSIEKIEKRKAELEAQIKELEAKGAICDKIADDLKALHPRLLQKRGLHSLFANSALKTSAAARHQADTFLGRNGTYAVAYSIIFPIEAELTDPVTHIAPSPFSLDRISKLGESMQRFGIVESGNIWRPDYTQLVWKQTLKAGLPKGLSLVTDGDYAGFFVNTNGDLIVPGVAFYNEVLADKAVLADVPQLHFHFRTRYNAAISEMEKRNYETAANIFIRLLSEDWMPRVVESQCNSATGKCFMLLDLDDATRSIKLNNLEESRVWFRKAIQSCPTEADPYLLLANSYFMVGDTNTAIALLDDALTNVWNLDKKESLRKQRESYFK